MAEEFTIRCVDKDHYWINGRQFISLNRVGEMMKEKHFTNADHIRRMSDYQLSQFLCNNMSCGECLAHEFCRNGHNGWIDWLQKEYAKCTSE